jgi:cyclophilin family peptidyl-prolyl cis-trans isomerase
VFRVRTVTLARRGVDQLLPVPLAAAVVASHSASSQIFFLLKESELTPSGANLLDGRYSVFGYAVQGQDNLGLMKVRVTGSRTGRVVCWQGCGVCRSWGPKGS